MKPVRVEPCLLESIAALEQVAFAHPWSREALELLCSEKAFGFACVENGSVLAYGGMLTVLDEGQITNIATHPDHRRRGLGTSVLSALLDEARARRLCFVTLEVRVSNIAAVSLYEKFGFRVVGKRPRFYTSPAEDALVMQCNLEEN
ncbi:MAG: ribosomal protein S18-alanine N-acetyltransferase [Clostridia bacterium]|nr:ribosomal protein S18-alanine N-acetyltransferase [Clostridia bacterium]